MYDIAAVSNVRVSFNGERVPVRNFEEYVRLYFPDDYPCPMFHQVLNSRWEICVTVSDGQFEQVSFVNSICTTKGGPHVKYIADQLVSCVMCLCAHLCQYTHVRVCVVS